MNECEAKEDGVRASEHHGSPTKDKSQVEQDGPIREPVNFKGEEPTVEQSLRKPEAADLLGTSSVTRRRQQSMWEHTDFKRGGGFEHQILRKLEAADLSKASFAARRRQQSMWEHTDFKRGGGSEHQIPVKQDSPGPDCVSMRSGPSFNEPIDPEPEGTIEEPRPQQKMSEVLNKRNLDSNFMLLEENILTFVKNQLNKFKKVLEPENQEFLEELNEDDEVKGGKDEEQRNSNRDAVLTLALNFLRSMKSKQLADSLQSKTNAATCQRKLKSKLKDKYQCLFEGIAKAGNPTLLNQIYTELYIPEGEVEDQHEVRQIEAASRKTAGSQTTIGWKDIFKPLPLRDEPVRTLVTKGVAGIGKTVLTQKYILDWAENKANKNVHFVFPFSFRELNLLKDKKYSLVELLHHFFTETKEAGICRFDSFQVLFIFDGLDECRPPLDFHNNEILTDFTESASVQVLLTNLIRGTLLPSARLWITTRPAAAKQIAPECIDRVTEVRGFNDLQKAEYFRRRFEDDQHSARIISHVEASRSLHVMCHIPVFCWITATVLDNVLRIGERAELPKNLTEMYIHFLVVQTKQSNAKYQSSIGPVWNTETKKTTLSLGKLAFEQLEKGNLIFYEADLRECGVDIEAASIHSGIFTEIFNGAGLTQEKVFCFVHLSVQEFLAALYVFLTFINTGIDPLRDVRRPLYSNMAFKRLYQKAVDKALESPNGHLDLFVRFLLGLLLETNQTLLQDLMKSTKGKQQVKELLVQYIKKKIMDDPPSEKSINLFHCLNELDDCSLVEEIQNYLRLGRLSGDKPSPSQWSALVFILLSSQKELEVFDLNKYSDSEEGFLKLLPVVKASRTALLSGCNLSTKGCEALASVLTKNCILRELDLSNNDLQDSGVKLLSDGLRSPDCKLEILSLSGCQVSEEGFTSLVSALTSNPSHLRELDLSFNHAEGPGPTLLAAKLEDPAWKLETLKIDHCGKCRLKPSILKYFCELSLDPTTAGQNLSLSDNHRVATLVKEKQPRADHPERFDRWRQLLCREGLTGRCYWEVQWKGRVHIGVTYRGINRRGDGDDCCMGWNDQSWSLFCTAQSFTAWHNKEPEEVSVSPSDSNRMALYLDWPAGTVSFYLLPCFGSSVKRTHLHTFRCSFTGALYPAFGFGRTRDLWTPSSVQLSQSVE